MSLALSFKCVNSRAAIVALFEVFKQVNGKVLIFSMRFSLIFPFCFTF